MRNIKMTIMYDGAGFGGWQRLGNQDSAPSIQGDLERVLSSLLQEEIKVIGSGRTDAGVHAYGQVANFHTKSKRKLDEIRRKINDAFPQNLVVTEMEEVPTSFHSRYDAKSKSYEYCIDVGEKPGVFTRKYATSVPHKLEIDGMKEAAAYIIGEHDFAGFSSVRNGSKDTVRTIYSIELYFTGNMLHIIINGNGFLYNMVRIIVGTLVLIGLGKKLPNVMEEILRTKDRQLSGPTMSSQGLFLKRVYY